MNKLIGLIILSISLSCTGKKIVYNDLPNDSIINVVIKRIVEIDSMHNNKNFYIAQRLCPYSKDYSSNIDRDSKTPPPSHNNSIINPISPQDFLTYFKTKIDSLINPSDTALYSLQIDYSTDRFLDTSLFRDYKLVNVDYKTTKDYYRLDSIAVFYVPIFTKDNAYVYVNYHYKGWGSGFILKNINKDWILISRFNTWSTRK